MVCSCGGHYRWLTRALEIEFKCLDCAATLRLSFKNGVLFDYLEDIELTFIKHAS